MPPPGSRIHCAAAHAARQITGIGPGRTVEVADRALHLAWDPSRRLPERPLGSAIYDAIVVGAGPNGLAAAVVLARAGRRVLVREAAPEIGGGTRTAELTLPGFRHDICSAVHPLAVSSPLFRELPLHDHGLRWIQPPAPLAHPFDDRPAAVLEESFEAMEATLGVDATAWRSLLEPFASRWSQLMPDVLGPLRVPTHPLLMARLGISALRSVDALVRSRFRDEPARALFAGIAAHAAVPLDRAASASYGIILAAAGHAVGWPIAAGGSQRITEALASLLRAHGGEIETDARVRSLAELPDARTVLLDLTPVQIVAIAGDRLPPAYRRALDRYRYGPGTFKMDWALAGPVPWRDPACARAGTVHLVGTLDDVARSEAAPWRDEIAERPFVLVAQQSLFDPSRAPAERHTLWAYCHVPNGSTADMRDRIERQIERFAPGFRDLILARAARGPRELEAYNANMVGGELSGGANILGQLFFRPVARRDPYATPVPELFICSSSTPPGGSVHGMCGCHAARSALRALA